MSLPRLTAITGGIGAGKSVISRVLRVMGYEVFDCDREAKLLMDSDPVIKSRLVAEIHPGSVSPEGNIDRRLLSTVVFADSEKLNALNSIVHAAVLRRIRAWQSERHNKDHIFVETAILYQSGLDKIVDDVIEVIAPDEIRIMRVMKRNNCNREYVVSRIRSQQFVPATIHPRVTEITNDDFTAVLPQLLSYLQQ